MPSPLRRILPLQALPLFMAAGTFFIALVTYLPNNPIKLAYGLRPNQLLFPQGWGFFTRNPREEARVLHRLVDGIAEPVNLSTWHGLRSFDRGIRKIRMESARLHKELDSEEWVLTSSSAGQLEVPNPEMPAPVELTNGAYRPSLCGDFVFERFEPLPWAWVELSDRYDGGHKLLWVRVQC